MLDFTSSLYLGMRHPAKSLRPWSQMTLGKPTALKEPPLQARLEQRLAGVTGCDSVLFGASTLHLFWDLFGYLSKQAVAIYPDAGAYPIARWGVQRAAGFGVPVHQFAHYSPGQLEQVLASASHRKRKPVIVCDGFCPGCGKPAPLAEYLAITRRHGGYLVIDDTQALGLLGINPNPGEPYGMGGGGSLRWHQIGGPELIAVSSLAKGFGVPVAMIGGNSTVLKHFEEHSETRAHCSPPSLPVIHAVEHALDLNDRLGDDLRECLAKNVATFRAGLLNIGCKASGGIFPVQTLRPKANIQTSLLHHQIQQRRVQTVLHPERERQPACISFILTARHSHQDIRQALIVLANAIGRLEQPLEKQYDNCLLPDIDAIRAPFRAL